MPKVFWFTRIGILLLLPASACMTTRLVGNYSTDNIMPHQKTTVSFVWGLLQPKDIPAECESNAVCKISSQTNLGYILLSAATLGLVVPQKITWDCCPSQVAEEKLNQP